MLAHKNTTLPEDEAPHPAGVRRFGRLSLVKSADNKNDDLKETQNPAHWEVDEEEEDLEVTLQTRVASGLRHIPKIAAPLTFLVLLGLWQLLTALAVYPAYILPAPATVAERWLETAQSGALWRHTQVTLLEAGLGFGAALLVVSLLAYPLAHSRLVSALLSPLLAATQAVPLVALAPLLVIWFGFGLTPKIITCALIVFFPLLLNAVSGLRSVDKSLKEAAAVFGASRWQTFWLVELPLSMRSLLTGVKIGFTVAFTGAVVGEFISSDAGLGYLLNLGRGQFDTPMVFVALLTLTFIAMIAYGLVGVLEKMLLRWQ
jgi:NitT/TauT family transport system permease protein